MTHPTWEQQGSQQPRSCDSEEGVEGTFIALSSDMMRRVTLSRRKLYRVYPFLSAVFFYLSGFSVFETFWRLQGGLVFVEELQGSIVSLLCAVRCAS